MLKMAVLAKQVPDTKHVVGDVMKADGTLNRSKLPAIFNPEDLDALELALKIKDRVGGHVTIFTMGPSRAVEILRDALARGADAAVLVTDRALAGSDTLATSIALAAAVRKIAPIDLVLSGRQAIDGDTAQTGPQTAQKLGFPQVTYVEDVREATNQRITLFRRLGRHAETIDAPLPLFVTVSAGAALPRPMRAKRLFKYRRARVAFEVRQALEGAGLTGPALDERLAEECKLLENAGLLIPTWGVEDLGVDPALVGLSGSPTKVHKCENVVLKSGEFKRIESSEAGLRQLVTELVHDHILG
jgi:electron transfer flavoprotein beta subunit